MRGPLGDRTVTISEKDTLTTALSEWTFCSWLCARSVTNRQVRSGRDEA